MKKEIIIYSILALIIGLVIGAVFFNGVGTKNIGQKTNLNQQIEIFELEEKSQLGEPSIQFSISEENCSKKFTDNFKNMIESDVYQLREIDCKIERVYTDILNSHLQNGMATTRAVCYCTYLIN